MQLKYHSLIVGQSFFFLIISTIATLHHSLTLYSGLASSGTSFQPMAPPDLLKKITSDTVECQR